MTELPRALALPASAKELSEFILKLLGRGRTIRKEIRRPFVVDLPGLLNLHHQIDQRITRQNKAALSAFEAEFEFNDGHTYSITSIEEFSASVFIQNTRCISARLNWVYIVEFSNRPPERQLIGIRFSAPSGAPKEASRASISFWVEHTEVTWGYDLFRHIDHYLDAHILDRIDYLSAVREFFDRHDRVAMPIVSMLFLYWSFSIVFDDARNIALSIPPDAGDLLRIESKVDFLVNYRNAPGGIR
jgi:hypothetical protein